MLLGQGTIRENIIPYQDAQDSLLHDSSKGPLERESKKRKIEEDEEDDNDDTDQNEIQESDQGTDPRHPLLLSSVTSLA